MKPTRRLSHRLALLSCLAIPPLIAVPAAGATPPAAPQPPAQNAAPNADLVKRGEYLARAGDCFSCHTKDGGGTPLAGGRQVQTPYGSISSPNITPDKQTGIGNWTDAQFYRLMHDGIGEHGQYIYPVMPFDHYTKVTKDDVAAIKAFLFSVPPVHAPRAPSHLAFPFDIRASLAAWRTLFFQEGTFKPDPSASAQVNRGAYLVEGLGHCGSCHTPRNILSGSKTGQALGGGEITGQGWFAPNISSDVREGLGSWSQQDVVTYLKQGVAPGKAVVAGPMAEVVHSSLTYLTDDDLNAIAAYLKAAPAKALYNAATPVSAPGAQAYLNNCAFCHLPDGKGVKGAVPPLVGNGAVKAGGPQDVIRTILGGLPAQGSYAPMPGYATALTSAQIADITNYIRGAWGNASPPTATTAMVDTIAKQTKTMLAGTGPCAQVTPPPIAAAIGGQGIAPLLQQVNAANMQQQIDAILPKLKAAVPKAQTAEVVNGLTAAYCPVAMADTAQPQIERVRLLQRFTSLVYSQLTARDITPQQHAGLARGTPKAE